MDRGPEGPGTRPPRPRAALAEQEAVPPGAKISPKLPNSGEPRQLWESRSTNHELTSFPETLAFQVGELCRKLATEREAQLALLHTGLVDERDRLKMENLKLNSQLKTLATLADRRAKSFSTDSVCQEAVLEPFPPRRESTRSARTGKNSTTSSCIGHEGNAAWSESLPLTASTVPESTDMQRSKTPKFSAMASFASDAMGSDLFVLRKVYRDLDRQRLGHVTASDVAAALQRISGSLGDMTVETLQEAILAVNGILAEDPHASLEDIVESAEEAATSMSSLQLYERKSEHESNTQLHAGDLTFQGFKYLILKENIEDFVPLAVAHTIQEIREYYVRWTAEAMILEKTRVEREELAQEISKERIPIWLEPLIGLLIMINALAIGVSQDVWVGSTFWTATETCFSVCFFLELVIKVYCIGCVEHFLGPGSLWNWFDLAIVAIAMVDVVFLLFEVLAIGSLPQLNSLTIVRLIRLIRMARLVRLLRMKFFKELTLMINGVIGGLRTLCWAFVFLVGLVYILGVLMRQLFELHNLDCRRSACTESEEFLYRHAPVLFSTVFRSMVTVFRCLIGDCNAPDGMPIVPHLMEGLGFFFTVGYIGVTCFVLFGVFNLIMAIFVENTLEAARVNQQKRQLARTKEHIRVAQELREIVLRICKKEKANNDKNRRKSAISYVDDNVRHLKRGARNWLRRAMNQDVVDEPPEYNSEEADTLAMSVGRELFEEVLLDPKVLDILEDLDISVTDRSRLFDVLDSNGSGSLDVAEIIEGLMKLRGPADKADIVCASLMVRSVQRDLHRLNSEMGERHKVVEQQYQKLQQNQARILMNVSDHDLQELLNDHRAATPEQAHQAHQCHVEERPLPSPNGGHMGGVFLCMSS